MLLPAPGGRRPSQPGCRLRMRNCYTLAHLAAKELIVSDRTATDSLAAFAAGLTFGDIPAPVRDRTKRILLDTIASAFAGNGGDEVAQIDELARAVGGPGGETTVIGRTPSTLAGAALLNGYLITAATVCDVHRPTLCHVTPEVVPPALGVAERDGSSGADLLAAVAAGLEV